MNRIIEVAKNKGITEIEVFHKNTVSEEVKFENSNLKNISSSQNSGLGIRGAYNNKIGICSITHEEEIDKALNSLVESSQYSDSKEFEFSKPAQYSFPKIYSDSVEKISIDGLVKDGETIIDKIKQYDKDVLVNVSFQKDVELVEINNSWGLEGKYKKSAFIAYVSGRVIDGTSFIETDCYKYGIDSEYDVDTLVNTFIERMKCARQESSLDSGKTNILFTPKAFKDILTTVSRGVNGTEIEKGISPLCNRLGEAIFDERFTLTDDATIDNNLGSKPFDDEGVPTKRNYIIQNGVLKSYIHSLRTASKTNSQPTGNGSRGSYDSPPAPSFNNMIIEPGNASFDELLSKMGNGIIIDEIMGLSMNNLLNGDFGGNVHLGFKVENGKIQGRIKNVVFNSNIYKILKNDLLGISDLNYKHPIINSVFSAKKQPCALFKDINITIK